MVLYNDLMCLLSGPSTHPEVSHVSQPPSSQTSNPRSIYPLTKSQQGIWVECLGDPSSSKYNLTLEWDVAHDDPKLQPTLSNILTVIHALTERHSILRSRITQVQNKAFLAEYAPNTIDPEVLVVHRPKSAVSEASITQTLRRPFSLTTELPARWVIVQDIEVFRVYIVGHHIALDGQSMTILSKEFLTLLEEPTAPLPAATEYSQMQMTETAWANSPAYHLCQQQLLSQVSDQSSAPWPKRSQPSRPGSVNEDYRKIDAWSSFPKAELEKWSLLFKTSWFRVATALVGLLVVDQTQPQFGRDEILSVGFGSRPKEMNACVGQFANALPIKFPLWHALNSGDGSFKSLVAAVGKNISSVKKAELFPAVDVIQAARKSGIDYKHPRVAVTYSPKLARSECRLFPVEGSWDLFFCFLEYEDDVKLGVIYDPKIFTPKALHEMKLQFDQMSKLSLTEGAKLHEMLTWLPTHSCLPSTPAVAQSNPHRHVHHWFDAHAKTAPDSLAFHAHELGCSLTYGALYASTEQKARTLLAKGVGRGDKLVVNLSRGFAVLEWILAILKCGAAFVYLDPDFSETARSAIISVCKPTIILDSQFLDQISRERSADAGTADNASVSAVEQAKYATTDDDLAYIIFTSGSTGEPKGVMVEHGNLAHYIRAATDVFECGFGTRILQLASFSFDASILEWTTALCTGGTLCFAKHPKQLVGDYLADVIEENEVSFLEVTPTALETLPLNRELPSLRQISIGGEAGSRELFTRWHSRVNLVNAYGPTEGAIAVCFNRIDKSDDVPDPLTVGPPNPETKIYICAEQFGPFVQPGFQGEICIAGPQVVRGYCERPEITARSFAVHSTGIRMYRTGDRGMILEDGSVLIMGRLDRELKVRGFRIASEEVENAILDTNVGVSEASAQMSESGLELIAFIAPATVSTTKLLKTLRDRLPAYKVPSYIYSTESLPKNTSGKIDHKAVRAMKADLSKSIRTKEQNDFHQQQQQGVEEDEHEASDNEDVVGQLWANVLGLSSPPEADVNFFDIGGHSLLVPKLYTKIKDTFPNVPVRLVDMFHQSTIKKQAALFGAGKTMKPKSSTSTRARTRKPLPGKTTLSQSASLHSSVGSLRSREVSATPSSASSATSVDLSDEAGIAVVGIAGRFPGAANADRFYELLLKGYSGIVPSASDSKRKTLPGNMWVPQAGSLDNVEDFDHEFWHLSQEEATEMDPQQRLFMEVAYEALVDADIDLRSNPEIGRRIGLFVGAANNSYHLYTESVASDPFLKENRGFVAPSISARTAYHLNVSGPNVCIQTNCASSTVALSLAFDSIRLGRCDIAIVGGVSVQLYEGGYITRDGQIFSPRGVCNPFDAKADGTVPADAVTAVVLKRYTSAKDDGTPVYARILGTGMGSDGALEKAGYQVPSPRGQAEVIKSAWDIARIPADRLRYAEIHGSGTPIGDALELEGLSLAMNELGRSSQRFTVGSTKGNIGNTQHTSGLVSLIKMCKSIQHGVIPATKGLDEPNAMINPNLPIDLAMQNTHLERDDIIAVSAAGWGGVNSHMVLAFPDEQLHKRNTRFIAPDCFKRKTLQAPRLKIDGARSLENQYEAQSSDEEPGNATQEYTKETASTTYRKRESDSSATVFQHLASELLGTTVNPDTDLKTAGLDSKTYVVLIGRAASQLSGKSLGVGGFLLSHCTPVALGQLYDSQQAKMSISAPTDPTASVLQTSDSGVLLIFLPGSEGSLVGATGLLSVLPKNVSIVAIEHRGANPEQSHIASYINATSSHIASAKKIVLVGVSLGGLSATAMARTLISAGDVDLSVVLLDSPPIRHAVKSFRNVPALYIGASDGQYGSSPDMQELWRKVYPQLVLRELPCGHYDLWKGSHGAETASLIEKVILKE